MSKILKNPILQKEVFKLKHVLFEELLKLHISLEDETVQTLAEKIFEESRQQEEEFFLHAEEEANELKQKAEEEARQILKTAEEKIHDAEEKLKQLEEEQLFQNKMLKETHEALEAKLGEMQAVSGQLQAKQAEIVQGEQRKKEVENSIQTIKDEGFKAGIGEGKKAGAEEAKKEVMAHFTFLKDLTQETQREMQRIIQDASREKEELLQKSEPELLALAMEIAKKIVRQEIQMNPTVVLSVARDALQKVLSRSQVHIKANPKDIETLKQYETELRAMLAQVSSFEIAPDDNVGAGGVVIETESGKVDARVTRQFQEMEKSLNAG